MPSVMIPNKVVIHHGDRERMEYMKATSVYAECSEGTAANTLELRPYRPLKMPRPVASSKAPRPATLPGVPSMKSNPYFATYHGGAAGWM